MDNASVTSEDSLKPLPNFQDPSWKVGPGALPADVFDPLEHNEIENFWHQVDYHFHPINVDHLKYFSSIPINPHNGLNDFDLRAIHPIDMDTSLNNHHHGHGCSSRKRDSKRDSKREKMLLDDNHHSSTGSKRPSSSVLSGGDQQLNSYVNHNSNHNNSHNNSQNSYQNSNNQFHHRSGCSSTKFKQESSVIGLRSSSNSFNSDIHNNSSNNNNSNNQCSVCTVTPIDVESPSIRASLNSFPYTQRLIAALIDENVNTTSPPTISHNRAHREDVFWPGPGTDQDLRTYQSVLETRIKHELVEKGWVPRDEDNNISEKQKEQDELLETELRKEQWKLRDVKTMNTIRKRFLYSKILSSEMTAQAERREKKRQDDQFERIYLERMISTMKKNKKSRIKFQKLLSRMFGHVKDKDKITDKSSNKKSIAISASAVTNNNNSNIINNININNNNHNNNNTINSDVLSSTKGGGGEEKIRSSTKKKKSKKAGNSSNHHDFPTKSASKGVTRKSAP